MPAVQAPAFEGIDNFRDFGGMNGRLGRVRSGHLFRSAHLAKASPADLEALHGLGLGVVADLRRFTERKKAPSRLPEAFAGLVIANDAGDRAEGPHLEFLRQGDVSDAAIERFLIGYYREAPFEERHMALFAGVFDALLGQDGALLAHCTAGKDRTGLLAALIQRALGVHDDDVMNDYLATNAAMMTPAKIAKTRGQLTLMTGIAPSDAMMLGFLGVEGRHLEAAFAEIDARAGGLNGYLAKLGVDGVRLELLRERLIA